MTNHETNFVAHGQKRFDLADDLTRAAISAGDGDIVYVMQLHGCAG